MTRMLSCTLRGPQWPQNRDVKLYNERFLKLVQDSDIRQSNDGYLFFIGQGCKSNINMLIKLDGSTTGGVVVQYQIGKINHVCMHGSIILIAETNLSTTTCSTNAHSEKQNSPIQKLFQIRHLSQYRQISSCSSVFDA